MSKGTQNIGLMCQQYGRTHPTELHCIYKTAQ